MSTPATDELESIKLDLDIAFGRIVGCNWSPEDGRDILGNDVQYLLTRFETLSSRLAEAERLLGVMKERADNNASWVDDDYLQYIRLGDCRAAARLLAGQPDQLAVNSRPALLALAEQWRNLARDSRAEALRIGRTVKTDVITDAEERCIARAEVWQRCAHGLESAIALAEGREEVRT